MSLEQIVQAIRDYGVVVAAKLAAGAGVPPQLVIQAIRQVRSQ